MRKKKASIPENKIVIQENIIERDFSEIMPHEFMQYTYAVVEERALPDARDGLKPSQRRILVAMNDLHLGANALTMKCAKICGDTSGNYHPHGEAVIYPTLVRMAQKWNSRYPLLTPQGNFGSIDADSKAAAMRYCVVGDTLTVSSNGLIPIKNMNFGGEVNSEFTNIDAEIMSMNGIVNKADRFFDCGKHSVSTIKTKHGYEITGTQNHPLLTLTVDPLRLRPIFAWKLIEEIEQGDWLIIDKNSNQLFPSENLNISMHHPAIVNGRRIDCVLPNILDSDLALVMGAIIAECNTSSRSVAFTNNMGDYAHAVLTAWERVFGARTIEAYFRKPNVDGWSTNDYVSLECHYLQIQEFMHNIGLTPETSMDKEIPFSILQSPKPIIAAFVRSMFEGDGSVENSKRNRRISLASCSEKLIKQTQIVLLRFGILSKFYLDKKRGGFRLCITGISNLNLFNQEIGFISRDKIDKLQNIIDRKYKGGVTQSDYIPFLSQYVRARGKGQWILKNNFDRLARINSALPKLQKALPEDVYKNVVDVVDKQYGYTQVVDKVDAGEQNVYSLRVDSSCHSFVANGFVNHNTESKLSKFGDLMLNELSQEVVDFIPNYNETLLEPTVLPSMIPNLLLNGAQGIAVGVATKIAPHNLNELVAAIKAYIQNPSITVDELIKIIPGPDFPNGGVLLGREGVKDYYKTGRGALHLEGVYEIDQTEKGFPTVVITELPYGGSPEVFLKQIEDMVKTKKIEGVTDLKDLSKQDTVNVYIEFAKSANVSLALNKILKSTCLRMSFNVNQTVLIDGIVAENVSLLHLLDLFIKHRYQVLSSKYAAELVKSQARIHILDGLISVQKDINAVVDLIMASESPEEAQDQLIAKGFVETEIQAKAVLAITLRQLTKLEENALRDEQKKLAERIVWLNETLGDPKKIHKIIVKEQDEIAKKYGDERRTKIGKSVDDITSEDLIPEEQIIVSITKDGYIKRMPVDSYKIQGRGTRGVQGVQKRDEDEASDIFIASSHDLILFFTNTGLMYKKKGYEIPVGSRTGKGSHVNNVLALNENEYVTNTIPVKSLDEDGYLVFITKKGVIKRSEMRCCDTSLKTRGFPVIKLETNDRLIYAERTTGNKDIFIVTAKGKAIRYPESNVSAVGRMSKGVRALNLAKDDAIAQMLIIDTTENPDIVVITEQGFGKRSESALYRCLQGRYAKGVDTIDKVKSDRNGLIVGACTVMEDDTVIILTTQGKIVQISVEDIKSVKRKAMGVKIVKLDPWDNVKTVTKVVKGALQDEISDDTDESVVTG